jgi:hypothetical protein
MLSHLVALSDILAISDVSHNAEKYVVIVTSLQSYKCLKSLPTGKSVRS